MLEREADPVGPEDVRHVWRRVEKADFMRVRPIVQGREQSYETVILGPGDQFAITNILTENSRVCRINFRICGNGVGSTGFVTNLPSDDEIKSCPPVRRDIKALEKARPLDVFRLIPRGHEKITITGNAGTVGSFVLKPGDEISVLPDLTEKKEDRPNQIHVSARIFGSGGEFELVPDAYIEFPDVKSCSDFRSKIMDFGPTEMGEGFFERPERATAIVEHSRELLERLYRRLGRRVLRLDQFLGNDFFRPEDTQKEVELLVRRALHEEQRVIGVIASLKIETE